MVLDESLVGSPLVQIVWQRLQELRRAFFFSVLLINGITFFDVLIFLSRSHYSISNTCILLVGNTHYRKPHNTRTICTMPLQSILEEGLHSRQSFLVRLTNQSIRRFLQPEKRPSDESYKYITNIQSKYR